MPLDDKLVSILNIPNLPSLEYNLSQPTNFNSILDKIKGGVSDRLNQGLNKALSGKGLSAKINFKSGFPDLSSIKIPGLNIPSPVGNIATIIPNPLNAVAGALGSAGNVTDSIKKAIQGQIAGFQGNINKMANVGSLQNNLAKAGMSALNNTIGNSISGTVGGISGSISGINSSLNKVLAGGGIANAVSGLTAKINSLGSLNSPLSFSIDANINNALGKLDIASSITSKLLTVNLDFPIDIDNNNLIVNATELAGDVKSNAVDLTTSATDTVAANTLNNTTVKPPSFQI